MKKFLLGVCAAAACWISDAEAMSAKTVDGHNISVCKCESRNGQFVVTSRWELGNMSYTSKCKCLYIDYENTEKKFNQERSKADITTEMRDLLCTLPKCIEKLSNLVVLCVIDSPDSRVLWYSYGIHLKSLPDSIGNLKNLRILDLSDNHLRTLPKSIGDLKNLEELDLSDNYLFSKLPESIGNLENLKILNLGKTDLGSLPKSVENLINLEELWLSHSVIEGQVSRYVDNRHYSGERYSQNWYRDIIDRSLKYWSLPPFSVNESSLDWSSKNLTQLPFCTHMLTELKKLDVSNNQLTKIPHLLKKLQNLEKLDIRNNPNLNHLPDFLWDMSNLKELKIDGKLIKDLPKNAEVSLDEKTLEDSVLDLTLASRNNEKMSDEVLAKKTGPYTVRLK